MSTPEPKIFFLTAEVEIFVRTQPFQPCSSSVEIHINFNCQLHRVGGQRTTKWTTIVLKKCPENNHTLASSSLYLATSPFTQPLQQLLMLLVQ
ncbi:hypothetical protein Q1695_013731 [Nippostrongylus brasiliensis]|nr:hypothetical protein Q1695_013731 [Nippostrongylus brasiliensis]